MLSMLYNNHSFFILLPIIFKILHHCVLFQPLLFLSLLLEQSLLLGSFLLLGLLSGHQILLPLFFVLLYLLRITLSLH